MSERIDHAAEARKHIEWAHDQQGDEGRFDFTVRDNALIAQAEATLALVEQQRIANLIALMGNSLRGVAEGLHTADGYIALHNKVSPEIQEVLGCE